MQVFVIHEKISWYVYKTINKLGRHNPYQFFILFVKHTQYHVQQPPPFALGFKSDCCRLLGNDGSSQTRRACKRVPIGGASPPAQPNTVRMLTGKWSRIPARASSRCLHQQQVSHCQPRIRYLCFQGDTFTWEGETDGHYQGHGTKDRMTCCFQYHVAFQGPNTQGQLNMNRSNVNVFNDFFGWRHHRALFIYSCRGRSDAVIELSFAFVNITGPPPERWLRPSTK